MASFLCVVISMYLLPYVFKLKDTFLLSFSSVKTSDLFVDLCDVIFKEVICVIKQAMTKVFYNSWFYF